MTRLRPRASLTRGIAGGIIGAAALVLAATPAQAQVPGFDLYIGAGVGQSNADIGDAGIGDLDEKDLGWKLFVGGRFASLFGAELNYINFGEATNDTADVKYKGLAAYGLVYLPLPIPLLDVYAKAGIAKVDVDIDAADFSTDDTQFAYGLGAQLNLGSWGLRAEYERFKVEDDIGIDSKPSLLSLSFTKSFL